MSNAPMKQYISALFLSALCLLIVKASASEEINHIPLLPKTMPEANVAAVRSLLAHNFFDTLSVSYSEELLLGKNKNWELTEKNQLTWDYINRKYHFLSIKYPYPSENKENNSYLETREYILQDGKQTLIFGKQKHEVNSFKKEHIHQEAVTIFKEEQYPFFFPFCYQNGLNDKRINVSNRLKLTNTKKEWIITEEKQSKVKGNSLRMQLFFDKKTYAFTKKIVDIIDKNGNQFGIYSVFLVTDNDYYRLGNLYFPKQIVIQFHDHNRNLKHSVRYTFDKEIKINEKISSESFIPKIKNGTLVYDALENKTYRFSNNKSNEKEAAANLDALFESAESAKRKHD